MKIVYKISNLIAGLAIIPVVFFLPMFRFIAKVSIGSDNQLLSMLGGLLGNAFDVNTIIENVTGINIEELPEFYTIPELYEMFMGENANGAFSGFDFSVVPEEMKTQFILFAVFFLVAIFFTFVTMISGVFAKKITVPCVTSALALASGIASKMIFTNAVAPLISGVTSVTTLLTGVPALASYKSVLKYLDFDIRILELSHAFTVIIIILAAIFILNVAFRLALSVKDA